MGLLTSLFAGMRFGADYKPWDDFFYQKDPRFGSATHAGIIASPEQAMRLSTFYSGVRLFADLIGYLPLHIYRRRSDGGKDRATDHPEYQLLRRRPNGFQTAIRWRQLGQRHIFLRGNFYNLIVASTRRIQELIPLDPDRMTVKLLPSGRRGYTYRSSETQPAMVLTQDEVFHVMGASLDGVTGLSLVEFARESIGRAVAEENHASRFWSQGASTKGIFSTEGKLTPDQRKQNSDAWQDAQGGWWNAHKVALLEGGLKWMQIGVNARDSQYIEGREFSVEDIARWFGVPPHMLGHVTGSTSWGTGIEQQFLGFLITALAPWLTTWEQDIDRQILDDSDDFFAEFLRDAMLQADSAARGEFYANLIQNGVMTRNEARARENLNPLPGLDEALQPLNMSPSREMPTSKEQVEALGGLIRAGYKPAAALAAVGIEPIPHIGLPPVTVQPERLDPTPGGPPRLNGGPPRNNGQPNQEEEQGAEDDANARARAVTLRAATRVVRKEIEAIAKWAPRYAGNPAGWREWAADYYGKHVSVLEEALGLDQAQARQYGAAHTAALLAQGVAVLEEWDRHAPAALTALALGEELVA